MDRWLKVLCSVVTLGLAGAGSATAQQAVLYESVAGPRSAAR